MAFYKVLVDTVYLNFISNFKDNCSIFNIEVESNQKLFEMVYFYYNYFSV